MNNDRESLHPTYTVQQKQSSAFKSVKSLSLLTIVILVVVLAGAGGYLLGIRTSQDISQSNKSVFTQLSPSPQTTIATQVSPTIMYSSNNQRALDFDSVIADWKTFNNIVVGYTIKYPEGVEINTLGSERDIYINRVGVLYGGQEGKVPAGGMSLLYRGTEGIDRGNDLVGMPSERIRINGYPALRVYSPHACYSDNIFIADSNNKRVIRASITTVGDVGFEKTTYNLFQQMLSTLSFTPEVSQ